MKIVLFNKILTIPFGWFEFFFAMYGILCFYYYGSFLLGDFLLVLMSIYCIVIKKKILIHKPLFLFLAFILLHDLIVFSIFGGNISFFINNNIMIILRVLFVALISANLDKNKIYTSFMIVGGICILGLLYHIIIVSQGGSISPIKLPLLPVMDKDSQFAEIDIRPSSFFPEPAAFVTYMMLPLFLCLNEKKLISSLVITLFIFLSTSTTGIFLSVILWLVFLMSRSFTKRERFFGLGSIAIVLVFFMTSSLLKTGRDKIDNTEIETTLRIAGGPQIYSKMPVEHQILGINAASVSDYLLKTNLYVPLYFSELGIKEYVYVPTFWDILIRYGVVGNLLYLLIFISLFRKQKFLKPYLLILLISIFSQSLTFNAGFVLQFTFIYTMCLDNIRKKNINDKNFIMLKPYF